MWKDILSKHHDCENIGGLNYTRMCYNAINVVMIVNV
jgi:hypothetical protein